MIFTDIFSDYSAIVVFFLAFSAFSAGFIDSVAGGGGLIQVPALLINLPNTPLATLFGTNKIASLSGTSVAAYRYSKRIKFNYKLLLLMSLCAGIASYSGAKVVSLINVATLKPIIFVLLILIAIYTFFNDNLGLAKTKSLVHHKQIFYGILIGLGFGFYDGFFGPGAGSFLVLGFVVVFGFEFIEASAYSKVINCMTNISALLVFIRQGNYIIDLAILMAICNILGNYFGTKLALQKGNRFIRIFFLLVVIILIFRFGYDIFVKQ